MIAHITIISPLPPLPPPFFFFFFFLGGLWPQDSKKILRRLYVDSDLERGGPNSSLGGKIRSKQRMSTTDKHALHLAVNPVVSCRRNCCFTFPIIVVICMHGAVRLLTCGFYLTLEQLRQMVNRLA
jgi:hypothetical protein